ncbi:MAG: nucleoside-diphosphate-sugar epimerase [Rhodothermales bacterium]|jgi:nucleoside-diphosphate-sugar epimerase
MTIPVSKAIRDYDKRYQTAFRSPGGAGFVGSHLCDLLLSEGHRATRLDNLATGRELNIQHLFGNPDFNYTFQDIRYTVDLEGPVDFIYHLASPASPKHYREMPFLTLDTGSKGTQNALDAARSFGARYLLASTSEVCGDPEVHPQVETYWGHVNSLGPRSVYDEAKRYAEAVSLAYQRERDTDVVLVRIFNTYGSPLSGAPRVRLERRGVPGGYHPSDPAGLCRVLIFRHSGAASLVPPCRPTPLDTQLQACIYY